MTIQNKDWLVAQIIRLTLSGYSQEEISRELDVSEGTVNAIVQEVNASGDIFTLQHEIAVVSKKSGQSIKELASNMAFANAIKRMAFEQNKIHSILKAIDSICRQDGSLKPDYVANLISQIFDKILKKPIPLDKLAEEIEREYSELNKLKDEINQTKKSVADLKNQKSKALSEYDLTLKELSNFTRLRESFEEAALDFENREEIHNVLCSIREVGYDARKLTEEVKNIRVIRLTKSELEEKCENLEKCLEKYQRKLQEVKISWNFLFPAIQTMSTLRQSGINLDIIFDILHILQKHIPFLSIKNLVIDIDTYGDIEGAIFKKKRELENLGHMQNFSSSTRVASQI